MLRVIGICRSDFRNSRISDEDEALSLFLLCRTMVPLHRPRGAVCNRAIVLAPFLIFWILIFLGRRDLGWRGAAVCIGIWLAPLIAFMYAGISPYVFVAVQSLFDCILILVVFKGDINIR